MNSSQSSNTTSFIRNAPADTIHLNNLTRLLIWRVTRRIPNSFQLSHIVWGSRLFLRWRARAAVFRIASRRFEGEIGQGKVELGIWKEQEPTQTPWPWNKTEFNAKRWHYLVLQYNYIRRKDCRTASTNFTFKWDVFNSKYEEFRR